jgi:hypothetical protein
LTEKFGRNVAGMFGQIIGYTGFFLIAKKLAESCLSFF